MIEFWCSYRYCSALSVVNSVKHCVRTLVIARNKQNQLGLPALPMLISESWTLMTVTGSLVFLPWTSLGRFWLLNPAEPSVLEIYSHHNLNLVKVALILTFPASNTSTLRNDIKISHPLTGAIEDNQWFLLVSMLWFIGVSFCFKELVSEK